MTAAWRMKVCSSGLLISRSSSSQPQLVEPAGHVDPLGFVEPREQALGQTVGQARRPFLQADPPPALGLLLDHVGHRVGRRIGARAGVRAVLQELDDHVGGGLAVLVAVKGDVADLVGDGDPLHAPRHQKHFAVGGNDQRMRREIAPMVEAGEIIDVLRRRYQTEVEIVRRHPLAQPAEARAVFLLREVEDAGGHESISLAAG
jgi:hypothetical protein